MIQNKTHCPTCGKMFKSGRPPAQRDAAQKYIQELLGGGKKEYVQAAIKAAPEGLYHIKLREAVDALGFSKGRDGGGFFWQGK